MTPRSLVLPLIALALALVSACEPLPPSAGPGPAGPGRLTAELQIAGSGTARLNGFPARYGQQVRSGDSVETGPGVSALVAFSDGTSVQLDERSGPVDLRWGGGELEIQVHGSLLDVVKGAAFSVVRVITDLAEAYVYSHVVVEMKRGRFSRFDLFDGQLQLVRPASPRGLFGGEYVQVQRGVARPEFGRTPRDYARRLLRRFDRWDFAATPVFTPERTRRCPDGQRWDRIEQTCVCPPELPYLQDNQCITCIGGMVWTGSQCECPEGARWDGENCRSTANPAPQRPMLRPLAPLLQSPAIICPRGEVWSAEAGKCIFIVQ